MLKFRDDRHGGWGVVGALANVKSRQNMIFFLLFDVSPISCAYLIFPYVPIAFYQNIQT